MHVLTPKQVALAAVHILRARMDDLEAAIHAAPGPDAPLGLSNELQATLKRASEFGAFVVETWDTHADAGTATQTAGPIADIWTLASYVVDAIAGDAVDAVALEIAEQTYS